MDILCIWMCIFSLNIIIHEINVIFKRISDLLVYRVVMFWATVYFRTRNKSP